MSITVAVKKWIAGQFYNQVNPEYSLFKAEAAWTDTIDSNNINKVTK